MPDTSQFAVSPPAKPAAAAADACIALVRDALGRIRFGDIRITVHEGRLVQIDITERTRLTSAQ